MRAAQDNSQPRHFVYIRRGWVSNSNRVLAQCQHHDKFSPRCFRLRNLMKVTNIHMFLVDKYTI